jgi:hypothetical protein
MDELHPHSVTGHCRPRAIRRANSIGKTASDDAPDYVLERDGYRVRRAETPGQHSTACMLVDNMYSRRGYHTESVPSIPRHPNSILLEASSGQHLFGTLTLGFDAEEGLLADTLYQEEINSLRTTGRKLCEVSKLAVDPQYGSKETLASIMHLCYFYAHVIHGATDLLIEVHPRHAVFYERRLGFRQIAGMRTCPRVNAPAVLLHIELNYMQEQISRHGGSRDTKERSLYPYFSPEYLIDQREIRDNRVQLAA